MQHANKRTYNAQTSKHRTVQTGKQTSNEHTSKQSYNAQSEKNTTCKQTCKAHNTQRGMQARNANKHTNIQHGNEYTNIQHTNKYTGIQSAIKYASMQMCKHTTHKCKSIQHEHVQSYNTKAQKPTTQTNMQAYNTHANMQTYNTNKKNASTVHEARRAQPRRREGPGAPLEQCKTREKLVARTYALKYKI